jgi:hypothetical protein
MLKIVLLILASIVLVVLIVFVLPILLIKPVARLFPHSGLAIHYRLYYTAHIVSRSVLHGYTHRACDLSKDQFGRTRVCVTNREICVSPNDWVMSEVMNHLAGELAPRLGFERGKASIHEEKTVFVFSDADSLY